MIRVLVVDDHAMVRAGISRILESEPDIEVVGQTGSGHDAVQQCRELKPDVILLDFGLPDIDGLSE
jgi:DNA-binding NarL/FixJ family response regulator